MLWILTISEDGAVPVHFKVSDGNTQDVTTHIDTWNVLHRLVGGPQFLYVAGSKLASRESLNHIHQCGGRFITVLPRSRKEDSLFKKWLLTHNPRWQEIARYRHPRLKDGPPDIILGLQSPIPDADGYRLIWFYSTHKKQRDAKSRQDRIVRALKELDRLKAKLDGPRSRYRTLEGVDMAVEKILSETGAKAMEENKLEVLALYPENRDCKAPATARVIEVFGNLQRNILLKDGKPVQRFYSELNTLQQQILDLLCLPTGLFSTGF